MFVLIIQNISIQNKLFENIDISTSVIVILVVNNEMFVNLLCSILCFFSLLYIKSTFLFKYNIYIII